MAHALIAGGGLIGLLTARELRARGFMVTVVERGEPGNEASRAGGGILSPLYPWRFPDGVTALARHSQAQWPDLAALLHERTGIDPEYRRTGMLVADDDDPEEVAAWAARHGVELQRRDARTIREIEPVLDTPDEAMYELPAVAQVRNPRLMRAVTALAVGEGVTIRGRVAATAVDVRGGRATGLWTSAGHEGADVVVICAGAWTPALLAGLGAEPPPIEPVCGQMILFEAPPRRLDRIVLTGGRYLIPRADGSIVAGSTVERTGFACATTGAARRELHAFATALMPALAEVRVGAHWAGLRPGSPDDLPTIDRHPAVDGLWVNAGHFRNGIATAPASATLLAAAIAGDEPPLDPLPFTWPPEAEARRPPAGHR